MHSCVCNPQDKYFCSCWIMIWHWYKFWKQEMVFYKLFFLGLFLPFSFWQNFTQIFFFLWSGFCGRWAGGGVWQADFSGMWLQTAVSFWKWTSSFEGVFEMDADMWELIQFVTYIGVCQRVGSPPHPPQASGCPLVSKNTGRVFLVLQLQSSCHSLIDPFWRCLTFCCRAFHRGSKEKGERIHSPLKCEGFVPCHWLLSDGDWRGFMSHHTSL